MAGLASIGRPEAALRQAAQLLAQVHARSGATLLGSAFVGTVPNYPAAAPAESKQALAVHEAGATWTDLEAAYAAVLPKIEDRAMDVELPAAERRVREVIAADLAPVLKAHVEGLLQLWAQTAVAVADEGPRPFAPGGAARSGAAAAIGIAARSCPGLRSLPPDLLPTTGVPSCDAALRAIGQRLNSQLSSVLAVHAYHVIPPAWLPALERGQYAHAEFDPWERFRLARALAQLEAELAGGPTSPPGGSRPASTTVAPAAAVAGGPDSGGGPPDEAQPTASDAGANAESRATQANFAGRPETPAGRATSAAAGAAEAAAAGAPWGSATAAGATPRSPATLLAFLRILLGAPQGAHVVHTYARSAAEGDAAAHGLVDDAYVSMGTFRQWLGLHRDHVWTYPPLVASAVVGLGLNDIEGFPAFIAAYAAERRDRDKWIADALNDFALALFFIGLIAPPVGFGLVAIEMVNVTAAATSAASEFLHAQERDLAYAATAVLPDEQKLTFSPGSYTAASLDALAGLASACALARGLGRLPAPASRAHPVTPRTPAAARQVLESTIRDPMPPANQNRAIAARTTEQEAAVFPAGQQERMYQTRWAVRRDEVRGVTRTTASGEILPTASASASGGVSPTVAATWGVEGSSKVGSNGVLIKNIPSIGDLRGTASTGTLPPRPIPMRYRTPLTGRPLSASEYIAKGPARLFPRPFVAGTGGIIKVYQELVPFSGPNGEKWHAILTKCDAWMLPPLPRNLSPNYSQSWISEALMPERVVGFDAGHFWGPGSGDAAQHLARAAHSPQPLGGDPSG